MELREDEKSRSKHLKITTVQGEKCLELPGCILYSRGGMIPHLTVDNLSLIKNIPLKVSQLPLATIYEQPGVEVMVKYKEYLQQQKQEQQEQQEQQQVQQQGALGSFHTFSSTEDTIWLLNIHDTYVTRQDMFKYNDEKSISVWAPSGRRRITPEEYLNMVDVFGLDVAVAPSDSIPEVKSKKRCQKSCDRTTRFLDECLRIRKEKNLTVPLLASVEGGDVVKSREYSAKQVGVREVDGYIIGGLCAPHEDWQHLLEVSLKHLPKDKVKFMLGLLTPCEVIQAVECGVHVFDSVIAHHAAERGCALNFNLAKTELPSSEIEKKNEENSLNNNQLVVNGSSTTIEQKSETVDDASESVPKKPKTEQEAVTDYYTKDLSQYEMDLNDQKFFDDDSRLVPDCDCYTCTHHVRAYVHHLLVTKEMLAPVLLVIHNITHWFRFIEKVRQCSMMNTLNELNEIVQMKYP